jgi:hypothetical protein
MLFYLLRQYRFFRHPCAGSSRLRLLLFFATCLFACFSVSAQVKENVPPTLLFSDFYHQPIAPTGPEMKSTLRQADGRVVRIAGYMVKQEAPSLGRFMFAARPVSMSEHADGDADDLPAALVTVYLDPEQKDWIATHKSGLIALTGLLNVGRLEESDGRVSWVRMHLTPEATRGMNAIELANHFHAQQHRH